MAVMRKTLRHKCGLPRGAIFQLCVGSDFFRDGFGSDREAMREAWANPEIRRQVYEYQEARNQRRGTSAVAWAEETFGKMEDKP
jgi:hypothetical protein